MPGSKKQTSSKATKKILIVEDERPLAHALELKFRHEGYETVTAFDGQEALDAAAKGKFNLILLDLIMPGLDGFAFLEKKKGKTKVIVLSNLGQEEDKERALKLGAMGYYVKSNTSIAEIVKHVKSALK